MARRCFLAYFTLMSCLVYAACIVAGQTSPYALKGKTFSFKTGITGHPDGILWKHNGNKVVEFDGQEEQVYKPFEDRITLDWHSAELNISNLRFEDSGKYELEADINKGLHHSIHKLKVIDKVTKPTINCEMKDVSSSNKSAQLVCSVEPGRPETFPEFQWSSQGNSLELKPGPKLTIPLGGKHDDEVHRCTVKNPLSLETATYMAKDCYKSDSSVALIASLTILGLLILVGGIILFLKLRKKACFANGDLEKQPPPDTAEAAARPLIHRESTLASKQPLLHLNNKAVELGIKEGSGNDSDEHLNPAPPSTPPPPLDRNSLSHNNSDVDEEEPREPAEEVPKSDPSDSEKPDRADPPAAVSDDIREVTLSDLEVPTSPHNTDEHLKAAPPSPPCSESDPSQLDLNLSRNDNSDVDEEELREPAEEVPKSDPSDSEKPDRADPPAAASDDIREVTLSDLEVPTSPHNTEPENVAERNVGDKEVDEEETDEDGEKKETDEDDEEVKSLKSFPAAPPRVPLPESFQNMTAKDTVGENKEDADSDQVTKDTAEKTARECDSSGEEERNESDEFTKDKQSPIAPEEKSSETAKHEQDSDLPQKATETREDQQPETAKPVSESENETVLVKDLAESEEDQDLYSDIPQQPPSPARMKTEIKNRDALTVCPDTAHADQEEEHEARHDSAGQSDHSEGKEVEKGGPVWPQRRRASQ